MKTFFSLVPVVCYVAILAGVAFVVRELNREETDFAKCRMASYSMLLLAVIAWAASSTAALI